MPSFRLGSRAARRLAPIAVAVGLALASCGTNVTPADESTPPTRGRSEPSSSNSSTGALGLIEDSADTTPFHATVRNRFERGAEVLEIREEIWGDGQGLFAFELIESLSLTSEYTSFSYPNAYEAAAVFNWRFRRFRVRGAARARQNYDVIETGLTPTIAGITCEQLRLERLSPIGGRPGIYEVDYDPASGLVLAWREFDAQGHAFRWSMVESIDLSPDFSAAILRGAAFPSVELSLDTQLSGQAGFTVRVPDVLPSGFELVRVDVLGIPSTVLAPGADSVLPTGDYARILATDGIDTVVFMHSATASSTWQGGGGSTPGPTALLDRISQGAWEIGFGTFNGIGFVAAGRVSDSELNEMIQTAF